MSEDRYDNYLHIIRSAERSAIIKASFQGAATWKATAAEYRIEPRHYPGLRNHIRTRYHSDGRPKTEVELASDVEQRKSMAKLKNKYYRERRALMRAQEVRSASLTPPA